MHKLNASILYNYMKCPHRPWRDLYGPQDEKSLEENEFLKLLWEKGVRHEEDVMERMKDYSGTYENIKDYPSRERAQKTKTAIEKGVDLIYQGVLEYDNLIGIPDLLQKVDNGKYIAIDIKSGKAHEGANETEGKEGKYKDHYAVQLCLYTELLERHGISCGKRGKIIDIEASEVEYNLLKPRGSRDTRTYWDLYIEKKDELTPLLENKIQNKPALCSRCSECHWYESCSNWAKENDDPSQIYYLGRNNRDVLEADISVSSVDDLLKYSKAQILRMKKEHGRTFLYRIGPKVIDNILRRARILHITKKPEIRDFGDLPEVSYELFFDLEGDPTQDFNYLHGVYERSQKGERFVPFVAKELTPEAEKRAWAEFWEYIDNLDSSYAVYYYAAYEKTVYKQLAQKYPDVRTVDQVEQFFGQKTVIDLYNEVVNPHTDWPLSSYSLKSIAKYLGFDWRDESPSGALSITWYNEYIETGNEDHLQRILEYNEDDCKATMVLKDYLTG